MHYGLAANKDIIGKQIPGEMCNESMQNNTGKYLANLQLFPGALLFAVNPLVVYGVFLI